MVFTIVEELWLFDPFIFVVMEERNVRCARVQQEQARAFFQALRIANATHIMRRGEEEEKLCS